MKRHIIACISLLLLLNLPTLAANYTVKPKGGGDYTNIQDCVNAMANGDTCTVYAGDYTGEGVITVSAGTSGNYKTLTVNPGDTVTTKEWALNSYNKINGFHIRDTSSPNSAPCVAMANGATDIHITNNNFYACQTIPTILANPSNSQSFVYIQNNTFTYPCSTSDDPAVCRAIHIAGDHWLIEGNEFSHTGTPILLSYGNFNIIRNNTSHNIYSRDPLNLYPYPDPDFPRDCIPFLGGTATVASGHVTGGTGLSNEYPGAWVKLTVGGVPTKYTVTSVSGSEVVIANPPTDGSYPMTGGNSSNCHNNALFGTEPTSTTQTTQHILIEGNTANTVLGNDSKFMIAQGDQCAGQCFGLIIRYNVVAHLGSTVVLDDNAQKSVNPGFYAVKTYNNTWIDTDSYHPLYGRGDDYSHNSIYPADINNLFYYPNAMLNFNPYASDETTDSTFVYRNNLAWCTGLTCNLHGHIYSRGNFTDDPGNIEADPKLTNYAANDFSLAPASPAAGAGSYLTTVAARDSGSGTKLLVDDAAFFQDGYGLSGVQADQIRVGLNTVVQISSINYATNTLNLAKPITRSPGDPICLFSDSHGNVVLFGNAPNIGALPTAGQQQAPAPPTGLTVSVS